MARKFNGSTDKIVLSHAVLTRNFTSFTLAAWINPSSLAYGAIFGAIGVGTIEFRLDAGGTVSYLAAASGSIGTSSGTVTTNNWWHVGMRNISNNSGKFYINGAVSGTFGADGGGVNVVDRIGRHDTSNEAFPGKIAEVAIWNAALSDAEMAAIGTGVVRAGSIRPASIVAYLRLDGYGSPALDSAASNNNGVLNGTTFVTGPPLVSAAPVFKTQNIRSTSAGAAVGVVFRRTLSSLGTRAGSRQLQQGM